MTLEEARARLDVLQKKRSAYDHALGLISYDGVTTAPKGTAMNRAQTMGVLSEELDDRLDDPSAEPLDLDALFGKGARVEADIGCGKGAFACECARLFPGIGILAVETLQNVIVAGCERAAEERLDNIRFVCAGAQYLWRYLPKHSLSRIYLNFSCPFPKSGHESKRLTSPHFLNIFKELLAPDGEIWQKTDTRDFSLGQFEQAGFGLRGVTYDLHSSDREQTDPRAFIITEYERRFIAQGIPINRVEAYLKQ